MSENTTKSNGYISIRAVLGVFGMLLFGMFAAWMGWVSNGVLSLGEIRERLVGIETRLGGIEKKLDK